MSEADKKLSSYDSVVCAVSSTGVMPEDIKHNSDGDLIPAGWTRIEIVRASVNPELYRIERAENFDYAQAEQLITRDNDNKKEGDKTSKKDLKKILSVMKTKVKSNYAALRAITNPILTESEIYWLAPEERVPEVRGVLDSIEASFEVEVEDQEEAEEEEGDTEQGEEEEEAQEE